MDVRTIGILQVANGYDPYIPDNSFVVDYTGIDWTTAGSFTPANYPYLTMLANTYEGCLITLIWNKKYNSGNVMTNYQIQRGTYTIKTHLDIMNNRVTEFQPLKVVTYTYTYSSMANLRDTLMPPCKFTKYYWHPTKQLYFYMHRLGAYSRIVFTCFPYTTAPVQACDYAFNPSGTVLFKQQTLATYSSSGDAYVDIYDSVAFKGVYAYVNARRRYTYNYNCNPYSCYVCCYYWTTCYQTCTIYPPLHGVAKLTFSGSSCSDYSVSVSKLFEFTEEADQAITSVVTIP